MRKNRFIWLIAIFVVMAAIFWFSNQTKSASLGVSDTIAATIHMSSTKSLIFGLSVRKLAHVGLFGLLGFASMGYFRSWWKAGILCYIYAVTDEIHQYFVPGRTPSVYDTFVDAIGFGVVIVVWVVVEKMMRSMRSMQNMQSMRSKASKESGRG